VTLARADGTGACFAAISRKGSVVAQRPSAATSSKRIAASIKGMVRRMDFPIASAGV